MYSGGFSFSVKLRIPVELSQENKNGLFDDITDWINPMEYFSDGWSKEKFLSNLPKSSGIEKKEQALKDFQILSRIQDPILMLWDLSTFYLNSIYHVYIYASLCFYVGLETTQSQQNAHHSNIPTNECLPCGKVYQRLFNLSESAREFRLH